MIKEGSYVRCYRREYVYNGFDAEIQYGQVVGPELRLHREPSRLVIWDGSDTRYQIYLCHLEEVTEKEYFVAMLRGK